MTLPNFGSFLIPNLGKLVAPPSSTSDKYINHVKMRGPQLLNQSDERQNIYIAVIINRDIKGDVHLILIGDIIVVRPIELINFILQNLQMLAIIQWNSYQILYPLHHSLYHGMSL